MCSLKKHHYWCLSPVFISGAAHQFRRLLNASGTRSPSSVWLLLAAAQVSLLSWAQLWCPWCRVGREGRAQPNQSLNLPGVGICSEGGVTKGGIGIRMSWCCACQGACAGGTVLLPYFSLWRKIFFFEEKSTVLLKALKQLKNDLSWIRFLMIMLIHLIALNQEQTKEWHGKYHKWYRLFYAHIKGVPILHQSIHTCTLCMFLWHFWPIILCVDFGETFLSSILGDVCLPVYCTDCILVFGGQKDTQTSVYMFVCVCSSFQLCKLDWFR